MCQGKSWITGLERSDITNIECLVDATTNGALELDRQGRVPPFTIEADMIFPRSDAAGPRTYSDHSIRGCECCVDRLNKWNGSARVEIVELQ
jgi:hypothetical protein